MVNEDLI